MRNLLILFSVAMLCIPIGVRAQTQEELQAEFLAHAEAMGVICDQFTGQPIRCFVVTKTVESEPTVCPDPLQASRLTIQQASTNVAETQKAISDMRQWFNNLSTTQLEQAKQALDQVLTDNPSP